MTRDSSSRLVSLIGAEVTGGQLCHQGHGTCIDPKYKYDLVLLGKRDMINTEDNDDCQASIGGWEEEGMGGGGVFSFHADRVKIDSIFPQKIPLFSFAFM